MNRSLDVKFAAINVFSRGDITEISAEVIRPVGSAKAPRLWPEIIIHHTWKPTGRTSTNNLNLKALYADAINRVHVQERKFLEMGYHFLINVNGVIQFGDRWRTQHEGSHVKYHNNSIGISLVGDFDVYHPTFYQLTALTQLVGAIRFFGFLTEKYKISYHRQYAHKTCPGSQFPDFVRKSLATIDKEAEYLKGDSGMSIYYRWRFTQSGLIRAAESEKKILTRRKEND